MSGDDMPRLGPCCVCGSEEGVNTIIMLSVKNTVPGHGWGCLACGLPMHGASAVCCDPCGEAVARGNVRLQFACAGYPGEDGRVPYDSLKEPHEHDPDVVH